MRADISSPETWLADAVMDLDLAVVGQAIHLINGGIPIERPPWSGTSPHQGGAPLCARLCHFDPRARRPGPPEDVAPRVTGPTTRQTRLVLINLTPIRPWTVTVQAGGYGEHRLTGVHRSEQPLKFNGRHPSLDLDPGAGAELILDMQCHVHPPTLAAPWKRTPPQFGGSVTARLRRLRPAPAPSPAAARTSSQVAGSGTLLPGSKRKLS